MQTNGDCAAAPESTGAPEVTTENDGVQTIETGPRGEMLLKIRTDDGAADEMARTLSPFAEQFPSSTTTEDLLIVIKVGTSTLLDSRKNRLSLANVGRLVELICDLRLKGFQVVLVSSGAVGLGCHHMRMSRPSTVIGKQAAAAIGQGRLMRMYDDAFAYHNQKVAQLLLARQWFLEKENYAQFQATLFELLRMGVVPIVNENDAFTNDQIRFGDNDTLAAYLAVTISAHWLFLLTDVDCLYTANPRSHSDAKPIPYVENIDDLHRLMTQDDNAGTAFGTGGMRTKILAARIAVATGIHTGLCNGQEPQRILDMLDFAEARARPPSPPYLMLENKGDQQQQQQQLELPEFRLQVNGEDVSTPQQRDHTDPTEQMYPKFHIEASGAFPALSASPCPSPAPQVNGYGPTAAADYGEGEDGLPDEEDESPQRRLRLRLLTSPTSLQRNYPFMGTIFRAAECSQSIRLSRRWILTLPVSGTIYIDDGAAKAVLLQHKSLLAVGVQKVEGRFISMESVALRRYDAPELEGDLARCLTNFSSEELDKIKGLKSEHHAEVLGYSCGPEVAFRDDIIFMNVDPVEEIDQGETSITVPTSVSSPAVTEDIQHHHSPTDNLKLIAAAKTGRE
ncbi:unnamed protein product [Vitrella brassicaformis CCMP3155]|uniref:PUA domain-containing protein n=4 Tax=Vitrella brassicaformis TaxID=1169539 RepID=A0A0G4FP19_VITBC|nr:unnamed protein product [Vitrella brassicaformis CCMP3155]|eukprot:CEM15971.1 unnamed protein product [Vitrella brassicaformis CCMP3155]